MVKITLLRFYFPWKLYLKPMLSKLNGSCDGEQIPRTLAGLQVGAGLWKGRVSHPTIHPIRVVGEWWGTAHAFGGGLQGNHLEVPSASCR